MEQCLLDSETPSSLDAELTRLTRHYKQPQKSNAVPIKFICKDYGFDCDFVTTAQDVAGAIEEYGKHSSDEHGIEYSKEALMQFIIRKG